MSLYSLDNLMVELAEQPIVYEATIDGVEVLYIDVNNDSVAEDNTISAVDLDDSYLVRCEGEDHWRLYQYGGAFLTQLVWRPSSTYNSESITELVRQGNVYSAYCHSVEMFSCISDSQRTPDGQFIPAQDFQGALPRDDQRFFSHCDDFPSISSMLEIEHVYQFQRVDSNFNSLRTACAEVLMINNDASVYAFGEAHFYFSDDVKPTVISFINEVMPMLIEMDVSDFLLEYFPPTIPQDEYETFFRTGLVSSETPNLKSHLESIADFARERTLMVLEELAELYTNGFRFNIYGVGITLEEEEDENLELQESTELITSRTAETSRRLLSEGRRIALYNGMAHNDFEYETIEEERMSGVRARLLSNDLELDSDDFIQIDIITPEQFQHIIPNAIAPISGVYFELSTQNHITIVLADNYDPY